MARSQVKFRRAVYVKPGEACDWPKHFRYGTGIWKVIRYLNWAAAKNPNRFWYAYVETIAKRCGLSKRATEYALEGLEQLGVIARVQNMLVSNDRGDMLYHGFLVAAHDGCCQQRGSKCCVRSGDGGLQGLFPKGTKQVLRVSFDVQKDYPCS